MPGLTRWLAAANGVAFAPTLGDIGTTLSHPASSSHRALTPEGRAALGISEGFFRVSVGLEKPDELMSTFQAGLDAVRGVNICAHIFFISFFDRISNESDFQNEFFM